MVFNRGDGQAGIAASAGLWRRYPPDEAVLVLAEVTKLLADSKITPQDRVKRAVKADRAAHGQTGKDPTRP